MGGAVLDFIRPRTFLTSGSMGTMGFGLPAAIGAQLANPGALVIDVDGDGSIRMNLGELETLTTYDIPVKVLLLNNLGDGMVRQWQDLFYANRYSGSDKTLHKKDFVKAVEADGFGFAKRVVAQAEVRPTLEQFVNFPGPAFLEVMVDPTAHVYPMVGPGMGYKDMITGKWIPSRGRRRRRKPRSRPSTSDRRRSTAAPIGRTAWARSGACSEPAGSAPYAARPISGRRAVLEVQLRLRARSPRRLPLFLNGRPRRRPPKSSRCSPPNVDRSR